MFIIALRKDLSPVPRGAFVAFKVACVVFGDFGILRVIRFR